MAGGPVTEERVSPERMAAGRDYLRALSAHGVELEGAAWALNQERDELALVLISSLVDRVGPKVVYDTLFRAYDAAVTPATIDPWLVELFTPNGNLAHSLRGSMQMVGGRPVLIGLDGNAIPAEMGHSFFYGGPYIIRDDWVYVPLRAAPRQESQVKKWQRFERHVQRAAA